MVVEKVFISTKDLKENCQAYKVLFDREPEISLRGWFNSVDGILLPIKESHKVEFIKGKLTVYMGGNKYIISSLENSADKAIYRLN